MRIFNEFPDRSSASAAAAEFIAESLRTSLGRENAASVIVSGGSTPKQSFEILSEEKLNWARVSIVPSDERWVAPDDESSNERLIRSHLMQGPAAEAQLVSLFRAGIDPGSAPGVIGPQLVSLQRPFSCALLGMGEDGHFASLFSDFAGLSMALDTRGEQQCVMVRTAGSPFQRISLTLSTLLDSRGVVLLFYGDGKRRVYEQALGGEGGFPIAALLHQDLVPVSALWAS